MRHIAGFLIATMCITFGHVNAAHAGAAGAIPQGAERLNRVFAVFDKKTGPGCTYVVHSGGKQIAAGSSGMADISKAIPLTPELRMDIGSASKSFTAAAILTLANRGKIQLSELLSTYFDDLPAWSKSVTVGDLIYMRSGVPDFLVRGSDGRRVDNSEGADTLFGTTKGFHERVDQNQIYAAIKASTQTDFAAGNRYAYSNANYILLRMIAEKTSGQRLGSFIKRSVPTGRAVQPRTQNWGRDAITKVSPTLGYKRSTPAKAWSPRPELWDVVGPSGIWVSASGLARWGEYLLSNERLSTRMKIAGISRVVDGETRGYAAGLMTRTINGETIAYHLGATDGFTAGLFILPRQKQSLAFTCNMNADDLIAEIASSEGAESLGKFQEMFVLRTWLGD